jgi:NADH-quinone oxidoreductase subunit C
MGKKAKPIEPPKESAEPESGKKWSDAVESLLASVKEKFSNVERRDGRMVDESVLLVMPGEIFELATYLKNNDILPMNFCSAVTGIDKINRFEAVYNLFHLGSDYHDPTLGVERVAVCVVIEDRENPSTRSLTSLWKSVDFQEREIYDLIGVDFKGHPDQRRILLDDDFIGHPLRKDYPLVGKWEDMQALDAVLDENQIKTMKEAAGLTFDPDKDIPPNFKR